MNSKKILCFIGALVSYSAVIIQLCLFLQHRTLSITETLIEFFCYFTILTNILVGICYTLLFIESKSFLGRILSSPKMLTAVTVYIVTVGLVYNIALRHLWHTKGIEKIADESLHVIAPILFLLFWFLYVPKKTLEWKNSFIALIYPLIYLFIILLRGAFSHIYPYPFIDVDKIGYSLELFANIGILCLTFLILSSLFIFIAKLKKQ